MKSIKQWEHFKLSLEREKATAFLLNFLDTFKGCSYFDRENNKEDVTLILHVISHNALENSKTIQFMEQIRATKIDNYQIKDELSELIVGEKADEIYIQASVEAMPCIVNWLSQIQAKQTSLLDLAFVLMSLYLLDPNVRRTFFCNDSANSIPYSYLSFRSHVDGYFIRIDKEESYREKIETLYQQQKNQYQAKFKAIQGSIASQLFSENLSEWLSLMDDLYLKIYATIRKKHVDFNREGYGYIADNKILSSENFHKKTQGDFIFYYYTRHDQNMKTVRLITGLIYLTLHRLGLTYLERNFLAYVISRTIEDLFSTNVDQSLKQVKKSIKRYYLKILFTLGFA